MMNVSAEILENVIKKLLSESKDVSLIDFKNEYIEAIKYTHSKSYVRTVETSFNQLLKFSDNLSLIKYDVRYLEKFIIKTFKRSKYSAALYYRTLKAAFNKAVDWDYIPSNPFNKIKLPKFQKSNPAYITYIELQQILKFVPGELKGLYEFSFFTGLRLSEVINFCWNNVNLNERTIQVGDKQFITKGKKIRVIPICQQVYDILSNRFSKILNRKRNFVFHKANGFPYTANYISKTFKKAARKAGIDDKIHMHSLRHSFASIMIKEGVSIYEVSKLLGHSSISVTEIYSHLDIDTLRVAVNKFNDISERLNG